MLYYYFFHLAFNEEIYKLNKDAFISSEDFEACNCMINHVKLSCEISYRIRGGCLQSALFSPIFLQGFISKC